MSKMSVEEISFVIVVALVTVAFVWLLLPFAGAVLWAIILALLFNPLQRRLEVRFGGRPGLAAAVSLLACICIVVIPGAFILSSLAREASDLYTRISSREFDSAAMLKQVNDALPETVVHWLAAFNLGTLEEIQSRLLASLGQGLQTLATRLVSIGQETAQLVISLGVMLYVLFFLFRDGPRVAAMIRRASPLSRHHTEYILRKFNDVVKATVKGNIIIAVIQGTIGGVTFWLLGIQAALLWGVVMALLSLLPAVGAFLVWGPVAAYLILTGHYLDGAILIAVGALVISMIDNLLRPPLVGKGTRLPDYVVLVSTLGGISVFGVNGFIIGPLIAALFITVWSLFTDDRARTESAGPPARLPPGRATRRQQTDPDRPS